MIELTKEEMAQLKQKHMEKITKLAATLEGTTDGEVGKIMNIEAPCLLRQVERLESEAMHILNIAEDRAARAGKINKKEDAPAKPEANTASAPAAASEEKPKSGNKGNVGGNKSAPEKKKK